MNYLKKMLWQKYKILPSLRICRRLCGQSIITVRFYEIVLMSSLQDSTIVESWQSALRPSLREVGTTSWQSILHFKVARFYGISQRICSICGMIRIPCDSAVYENICVDSVTFIFYRLLRLLQSLAKTVRGNGIALMSPLRDSAESQKWRPFLSLRESARIFVVNPASFYHC